MTLGWLLKPAYLIGQINECVWKGTREKPKEEKMEAQSWFRLVWFGCECTTNDYEPLLGISRMDY